MLTALLPQTASPVEVATALQTIPGVKVRGSRVSIPAHAAPYVDRLLQHLGVQALSVEWTTPEPSPITWERIEADLLQRGEFRDSFLGDYPLPHQRVGIAWACSRYGSLLHHPTGSGKTYEAIAIACAQPPMHPAIVVTLTSTVVQFTRQVEKYTHLHAYPLRSAVHARKRDRWDNLDTYLHWCASKDQRPIVVVGYETLTAFRDVLLALMPATLVIDESHRLKSWKRWMSTPLPHPGVPPMLTDTVAQAEAMAPWLLAKAAYDTLVKEGVRRRGFVVEDDVTGEHSLLEPADNRTTTALTLAKAASRRVLTTATPIRDRVRDLYAQLTLCEPTGWGSWTDWSARYTDRRPLPYNANTWDTRGLSNATELTDRISSLVNTVPAAEVRKHLPGFRRETLYVETSQMVPLTDKQRARFRRETLKARNRGASALVEVAIAEAAARCRKGLLDRIETHVDSGHKIVVFTVRKWLAKALEGHVRGRVRKRAMVLRGTGEDSQNARRDMLDAYVNHEGAAVLIGTGHAWGTSTDGLQCTHAAFFLGHPYEPGELDQWEGRFPRMGQTEAVVVYYVVGEGTVLETIAEKVIAKLPAIERVADSGALKGVAAALGGTTHPEALTDSILAKLGIDLPEES